MSPMLYIVMKSDLKTLSTDNELFKSLVPEHAYVDLTAEFFPHSGLN